MPFVRVDDLVVHYELTGPVDAPVVAFGNSLGTSYHLWDANVGALSSHFRLLRYDMRGHGLTSVTPGPPRATVDALAEDFIGLIDTLGIDRVRYVGLSVGGMVGQKLAGRFPQRVEAIVLCATGNQLGTPEMWNARFAAIESGGLEAIVDGAIARWFTLETLTLRPELVEGFRTMICRTAPAGYIGVGMAVRDGDLRADDAAIAVPTLIISGADDQAAPPDRGEALHAAIPHSRFVLLQNAAHLLNVEQDDRVNALLSAFLANPARAAVEAS
jgi:3-oxoadipate enol-lactonase